ncbi:Nuclear protein localization protein 4 [Galdieria sulphuraria]|uniref:Nuclear import protein NPL4-like protein n=1 Tax=Galdieria sulphuraria TaxID=130081 RepID=M2XKS8_GALSU|nr:nuclear import protein NPL4-like protein [Galdieria sulphuraria]EME30742.1 nuclear import protein NPL4-like protein [Galdieria sulphuraria]GJD10816.1 Nuclear protein localization protein 4 [Galdieria sulphuraria]|eukprot:XP_005707262.1 nuclear import protein NPL4-like protein [Galdieria sulphuraria]
MIIRLRLPDGSTKRVEANDDKTVSTLLDFLKEDWLHIQAFRSLKDTEALNLDATVEDLGLKHGDMLYLKGISAGGGDIVDYPKETGTSVVDRDQQNSPFDSQGNGFQPKLTTRCLHGPRGMCEHCMPKEDPQERYRRALEQLHGLRGGSIAALEAAEAMKFHIKAQEESYTNSVSVDHAAAFSFQANLVSIGFQQQRLGFLYGRIEDSSFVFVDCIYEPPQSGTYQIYKLESPEENPDAAESKKRADKLASLLGLEKVGWIFSSKPRKCIFSAVDILTACQFQCEAEEMHGKDVSKTFVTITVSVTEEGMTRFEAYQISDLCLDMYKASVFAPVEQQKPNSGKIRTKEEVIVEGVECRSIDTDFFLVSVPIKDHHSWLKNNNFPVENREQAPVQPSDLSSCLGKSLDEPFIRRISDFHLLLYISNVLDMDGDMPLLCNAVREQRELTDEEEGYRLMIEAIANADSQ